METKTIELHNTLSSLKPHLDHLNLAFPLQQIDLDSYWDFMGSWLADELKAFADGIKPF